MTKHSVTVGPGHVGAVTDHLAVTYRDQPSHIRRQGIARDDCGCRATRARAALLRDIGIRFAQHTTPLQAALRRRGLPRRAKECEDAETIPGNPNGQVGMEVGGEKDAVAIPVDESPHLSSVDEDGEGDKLMWSSSGPKTPDADEKQWRSKWL